MGKLKPYLITAAVALLAYAAAAAVNRNMRVPLVGDYLPR